MKLITAAAALLFSTSIFAGTITGAGASFPAPVYFKWAAEYQKKTGNQINYQSIGSSGGIKQIDAKTVLFGASDVARPESELKEKGQIQFPMVKGGVVAVVNIPGVEQNQLDLTDNQLADIFSGKIINWKDVDSKLPDLPIALAVRSDGSGTTAVFTGYLSGVSKSFKEIVGEGKQVKWKGTSIGGKGNAGVAAMVKKINGSIGYVEYAYAKHNALVTTKVNGITANLASFQAGAWPITAETYIILYPTADVKPAIQFFEWCYNNNQIALELDYVPLSNETKEKTRALWKQYNLK